MIKSLIILFNTVSVFLFSFFMGDGPVSVKGDFPKTAKQNIEFPTSVTINKGTIAGFAKFQMSVPQGFSVKELEVKGGSFSFQDNIAKIIWTALPGDAEFTVKFNITADATASGAKSITSKFSYINNNVKEIVEMTPADITVEGSAEQPVAAITSPAAPAPTTPEPIATKAPETAITPEPTPVAVPSSPNSVPVAAIASGSRTDTSYFETGTANDARITCKRSISKDAADNTYNIEVKIKKSDIKGFAKFQELLPEGYTAKGGTTSGSSFSVADGKAKFVWVSLPPEEEIIISYKLEKVGAGAEDASLTTGEFSYLENDQSKKVRLPMEIVSTSSYAKTERVPPTYTPPVVPTETQTNNSLANNSSSSNSGADNSSSNSATNAGVVNTSSSVNSTGNVAYVVQIGAFINAISSDRLATKFNVTEKIKSELSEGFSKFMVGNFGEYSGARSHRETMKQKGCASAFVVAYNGAKRITVQEALMITNQKWFK